ncbi:alpha/beta fold hydrolase [Rhodococcus sp. NM-2]|uniref:alpha/beta fold hydrolase n=1 Tax=Rhodococcus sp. NM-2 TaxID=3401174 RepID=UPI003AABCAD1
MLLVHGFGLSHRCWDDITPALASTGFRTVAYDHRGHGRSSVGRDGVGLRQLRDDLRSLLIELDLDNVIILSHSMGTFVALDALDDPVTRSRVNHLVLVNPITGDSGKGAPTARLQGPLVRHGIAQWLARGRRIGNAMARMSLGRNATADVVEATRRGLAGVRRSATPMIDVLRKETVADVLTRIDTPTTILVSASDKVTPAWHARLIVSTMPSARLEYVPDVGHMTQWEAPRRVVEAVSTAAGQRRERRC